MEANNCPSSPTGEHRLFIFKVMQDYEPVPLEGAGDAAQLYKKVEYTIAGCNCGLSVKSFVRTHE